MRYFIAVGHCLSFTKAAQKLNVSQPPLSRQIQELEEELGLALFDRAGKKTRLTEAGEYFLAEAERALESLDAACRTAKTISEGRRTLNIGCVNFFFNSRIAPCIEEIRRIVPVLRIDIKVMPTEDQEKALLSGALDVGFVRAWVHDPGLVFEAIGDESMLLIFPKSLDLADLSLKDCLSKLSDYPFVGMDRTMAAGLAQTIANACTKLGISPKPAYECNDAYSIIGLVASGLGWSIVPDLDLSEAAMPEISCRELQDKIVIGMCYKKGDISDQAKDFIVVAKSFLTLDASAASLP